MRESTNRHTENYRSCTLDCAAALRLNPKNVKAYYRSSRALLSLSKITDADDACARGLALDPDNAALRTLATQIISKNEEVTAKARKVAEREARQKQEVMVRRAALLARGIRTRKTEQPPEMEDAGIKLDPDPLSPTSMLTFPTVLLYPLHLESDFIKAWRETDTLPDHLNYIFPLPWDVRGEYTLAGVEGYMETVTGGLVKVGKKVSLLRVLSAGNVEVVDEVVRIFVVPKTRAEEWIQDWKMKKAAGKSS